MKFFCRAKHFKQTAFPQGRHCVQPPTCCRHTTLLSASNAMTGLAPVNLRLIPSCRLMFLASSTPRLFHTEIITVQGENLPPRDTRFPGTVVGGVLVFVVFLVLLFGLGCFLVFGPRKPLTLQQLTFAFFAITGSRTHAKKLCAVESCFEIEKHCKHL